MPLINGQKMACEPCIRGHRSTKCTHANERLMVPVRKPGRPLSTCPHPPARGCGCGSVTAAIPRKQKCGCGSSTAGTPTESSAASSIIKAESPASDAPPMSPTKAPATSFRVQKPTAKSASRKQSFDPANLERMDAAHVNILNPYEMAQASSMPHANGMAGIAAPRPGMEYGAMPMMAPVNGGFHQPMMYPMFPQQIPGMFQPGSMMPQNGALPTAATPKVAPTPAPAKATNGGSCCSGSKNGTTQAPTAPPTPALTTASTKGSCCSGKTKSEGNTTQSSSVNSSPKAQTKPKTGGCCSSKAAAPPINTNVVTNGHMPNGHMSPNGMAISPFQTPIAMPQGMYQSYFQPHIFTYPPQYGSYMSPLQPAQWKETMDALQYGQPTPQPTGFNMSAPLNFAPEGANPAVSESTSHMCTCGDGCQCIGCAAHPYNDATQDYVRSAWESMLDDSYGTANGASTNGHVETAATTTNGTAVRGVEAHTNGENGASPPAPQTPSDAASGLSEEQALSASDFFFVTYPFGGDACAGETSSCPCGDDCHPRESGRSGSKDVVAPVSLPYDARALSKNDLDVFRPLLAYYLDLQKQKDVRDMDEREVRGRWKSFVGKWNRGELSSGWYDPEMFMSAKERWSEDMPRRVVDDEVRRGDSEKEDRSDEDDDEEDLGPRLPPSARDGAQRSGPGIPSLADLNLQREDRAEDAQREREAQIADLRSRRKDDRKTQKERLDELVPRAEAGTRERMLEKRALVNEKMKDFKDKGGDGQAEVGERELMGGGDSLAEYKAMKAREERKKTEREIRREEVARARAAEREERVREYREREEGVMKGLKELAKQRFG
ncbi:grisea protein [Colletotrichum karsti]|uniref:Grisea protein n=1 Tax=Colletotrichum karsti TaxID=1095194 RepID=A0A9P6LKJ0_9PEZI|nr:grisea protein [Colletotrichum karsti]KAF9876090.1 grisea protein [Colletotrichum karsti]